MTISKDNFDEIYLNWFVRLCRFASNFVVTAEDAENLVQSVFISIWEKRLPVEIQSGVSSYLYTLVKNKCIDYLRHQKVAKGYRDEYRLQVKSLDHVTEIISSHEDMEQVFNEIIGDLPDRCRTIFILSRVEGKKYREIAQILNLSENTVENQIGIALKKIRENLVARGF